MTRRLHLNAFLMNTGHHEASWRLPESDPYAHVELAHYVELARIAERGTFDSLFLADGPQLWSNLAQQPLSAWNRSPCSPRWRRPPSTSA